MVTKWGMGTDPEAVDGGISGRGSLSFFVPAAGNRSLPSDIQAAATRAIRSILDEAYAEASRTLVEHMETLRRLAAWLVEHERVDGATFDELFEGRIVVPSAGDEWRAATSRPRAWGDVVDFAGRRNNRASALGAAPAAAAAASATTPGEANGEPLPTPAAASGGAPAAAATALVAPAISAAIDVASVEATEAVDLTDSMPAATAPERLRRRRIGPRPSRRSAFARFVRATVADGLALAEGRVRPRRSNEERS